jgi:hypothetical protein
MERLAHATRSKGIARTSNVGGASGKQPAAVRKLNSNGEWNFKVSGCSLPNVEVDIANTRPSSIAEVAHAAVVAEPEPAGELPANSYFRFIGETESLGHLFNEATVCSQCKRGQLDITFETKCLATSIHTRCRKCRAHSASTTAPTGIPQDGSQDRNINYAANILFVLAQLLSGNGGTETSRIIGMLDLPNQSMGTSAFPALEYELSRYIIPYTKELMENNLVKEVELYASTHPEFCFESWKKQHEKKPDIIDVSMLPLLTVAYDMAWQKRSSGHRYDSHSGHAIPVGVLTNLPIGLAILNKYCTICSRTEDPGDHDCFVNFEGTSGAMEAAALVQLAHSLLEEQHVLFGTIVADDDSSIRAQMKWSNADWMVNHSSTEPPRVITKGGNSKIRPDRGQLRREYPEPGWLNDPSHRGKTLGGDLRSIEKQPKAISKGINKVDCIKLHRNFGYMVKQLKECPQEEWVERGQAVLEHHFENHVHCDSSWCHRKQRSSADLETDRKKTGKYYRCKERDKNEYQLLKAVIDKYITMERLKEVAHGFSTQMNESMNNSIAWLAQKNKTLSGTCSLAVRIHLAVGITLVGYEQYIAQLCERMGIELTNGTAHHLRALWKAKDCHSTKQKKLSTKRQRQEGKRAKLEQEIQAAEKKRRKEGYYKPGEGFNECVPIIDPKVRLCRAGCGGTDHLTSQSRKCSLNLHNKVAAATRKKETEQEEIQRLYRRIRELEDKNSL